MRRCSSKVYMGICHGDLHTVGIIGSSTAQGPGHLCAPSSQLTADFSASGDDGQIFGAGGHPKDTP